MSWERIELNSLVDPDPEVDQVRAYSCVYKCKQNVLTVQYV